MGSKEERRVKLVSLRHGDVLDWFASAVKGWPQCITLPRLTGLPEDVTILGVHQDFHRRQFVFLVSHPSFEVVPEGQIPPDFTAHLSHSFEVVSLNGDGERERCAAICDKLASECNLPDAQEVFAFNRLTRAAIRIRSGQ